MKAEFNFYRCNTILFLVLLLSKSLLAQNKAVEKAGIAFKKLDLKAALALSRTENKPLFVEIYLNGCPHCEALTPVLEEKEVGDFYNANFISWKTEANSADAKELQKLKNITFPEFPLFFYFDPEGNLMHMATPVEKPDRKQFTQEVIRNGQNALNPKQQTAKFKERFAAGDRGTLFLINYGKYVKAVKDEGARTSINDAFASKLVTDEDKTGQVGFFVLRRFISDCRNPLAVYFFSHLSEYKALYPAKDVNEAGEAIIFNSLFGPQADTYTAGEIATMRDYMVVMGVSAGEASSRTLLKEMDACLRAKDTKAAVAVFDRCRKISPTISIADYAYILKYFNEKATDLSYLDAAPTWAEAAMRMAKPQEKQSKLAADLHYELAEAYLKSGKKVLAREASEKGLAIAKMAKIELIRYEKQVDLLVEN